MKYILILAALMLVGCGEPIAEGTLPPKDSPDFIWSEGALYGYHIALDISEATVRGDLATADSLCAAFQDSLSSRLNWRPDNEHISGML